MHYLLYLGFISFVLICSLLTVLLKDNTFLSNFVPIGHIDEHVHNFKAKSSSISVLECFRVPEPIHDP